MVSIDDESLANHPTPRPALPLDSLTPSALQPRPIVGGHQERDPDSSQTEQSRSFNAPFYNFPRVAEDEVFFQSHRQQRLPYLLAVSRLDVRSAV